MLLLFDFDSRKQVKEIKYNNIKEVLVQSINTSFALFEIFFWVNLFNHVEHLLNAILNK